MRISSDILVIGGGVVGTSCALHLARRGHDVLCLNTDSIAGNASLGNAGHIATEQIYPLASVETILAGLSSLARADAPVSIRPGYALRALPWLARFCWSARPAQYRRGASALRRLNAAALPALRRLIRKTRAEGLLVEQGHYVVSDQERDRARERVHARWTNDRVGLTDMGAEAFQAVTAKTLTTPRRVWHFDRSAHIRSPARLLHDLAEAFIASRGRSLSGRAQSIHREDSAYICRTQEGAEVHARRIVVASGPDSARLLRFTGLRLPLECEGGYHLHVKGWTPPLPAPVIHADRKFILTPMEDGTRISGFVEFAGWQAPPDRNRFRALAEHLRAIAPTAPLDAAVGWHGFRPSLPDHLPAIGAVPGAAGLYCATAHQHLGLTLSAITAEVIGDLVEDTEPRIDLTAFQPHRFGWQRMTRPLRDSVRPAR